MSEITVSDGSGIDVIEIIDAGAISVIEIESTSSGGGGGGGAVSSVFGRIGAVTASEGDYSLNQMGDVTLTTPQSNDTLKYNGAAWINTPSYQAAGVGAGVVYFLSNAPSGVSTYEIMDQSPDTTPEVDESIVIKNETKYFEGYISRNPLNRTIIDAGIWSFGIYSYVSHDNAQTVLEIHVYKISATNVETLLFQCETANISALSPFLYDIDSIQPQYMVDVTDKLLFKIYARTNRNTDTTVHLLHSGTEHYTHCHTPITPRHNDLSGLDGGSTTERYHLTAAEYVGSGTGIFVRANAPALVNPTGISKSDVGLSNVVNALQLQAANNLSDVTSASTSRTNLGLGTAATQASSAFDAAGSSATAQAFAIQRSNHTGTQAASTISDFSTAADARITLQKGAVGGVCPLNASSQIDSAYIPASANPTVVVAANPMLSPGQAASVGALAVNTATGGQNTFLKVGSAATDWAMPLLAGIPSMSSFFCDFDCTGTASGFQSITTNGSTNYNTYVWTGDSTSIGVVAQNTTEASGWHYYTQVANNTFGSQTLNSKQIGFYGRLKLGAVPDAVSTNIIIQVGFGNTKNGSATAEHTNGFYFYASNANANWICKSAKGGARTSTTSSVAISTNWVKFQIVATTSSILFYIDGVLQATHTTNIPSGATETICIASSIQSQALNYSGTKSMYLDYLGSYTILVGATR